MKIKANLLKGIAMGTLGVIVANAVAELNSILSIIVLGIFVIPTLSYLEE